MINQTLKFNNGSHHIHYAFCRLRRRRCCCRRRRLFPLAMFELEREFHFLNFSFSLALWKLRASEQEVTRKFLVPCMAALSS